MLLKFCLRILGDKLHALQLFTTSVHLKVHQRGFCHCPEKVRTAPTCKKNLGKKTLVRMPRLYICAEARHFRNFLLPSL